MGPNCVRSEGFAEMVHPENTAKLNSTPWQVFSIWLGFPIQRFGTEELQDPCPCRQKSNDRGTQ